MVSHSNLRGILSEKNQSSHLNWYLQSFPVDVLSKNYGPTRFLPWFVFRKYCYFEHRVSWNDLCLTGWIFARNHPLVMIWWVHIQLLHFLPSVSTPLLSYGRSQRRHFLQLQDVVERYSWLKINHIKGAHYLLKWIQTVLGKRLH